VIFWLGLAVILAGIVALWAFVRESPVRSPGRIDWIGALLLSGGLSRSCFAVSEGRGWGWASATVVGLFAAAAVLLVAFAAAEVRIRQPLVDVGLLRRRAILTSNVAA